MTLKQYVGYNLTRKVAKMGVNYNKLIKALDDNGYNSYTIKKTRLMSCGTYQNLKNGVLKKRNGSPCGIDLETLDRISKTLEVSPWDLVEFTDDKDNHN